MPRPRSLRRPPATADSRSPLERLESFLAEPGDERRHRIFHRIRKDLDDAPVPGPWIEAARTLRDRGQLSDDAVIYLAEIFTECLLFEAAVNDPELVRIRDAMDDIEADHGLDEDEDWYVDEAPPDWQALSAEWDRRADAIVTAKLRELGFRDLADVRARDMDEWAARADQGYQDLWGMPLDDALS